MFINSYVHKYNMVVQNMSFNNSEIEKEMIRTTTESALMVKLCGYYYVVDIFGNKKEKVMVGQ